MDKDDPDFDASLQRIREQFGRIDDLLRAHVDAEIAYRAALLSDLEALVSGAATECGPLLAVQLRAQEIHSEVRSTIETSNYLIRSLQRRILEHRGLLPKRGERS